MVKRELYFLSLLLSIFLLSGCIDFEQSIMHINLEEKTGVLRCLGLVSDATDKDGIELDVKDLIENFYRGQGIENELLKSVDVLSKEFYVADNRLNVKIVFSFKNRDVVAALHELGIKTDSNGDYVSLMGLDDQYLRGNAVTILQDTRKYLKWGKKLKTLDAEIIAGNVKNKKVTNVVKYWLASKDPRFDNHN